MWFAALMRRPLLETTYHYTVEFSIIIKILGDCIHTLRLKFFHSLITQHPWVVFGPPKHLFRYDYICVVWENDLTPVVYQMSFDILLRYAIFFLGLLAREILF